jgi:hypothetical protein
MNYRMITPYSGCPSFDDIIADQVEMEHLLIDTDESATWSMKKPQVQPKRKPSTKYISR